MVAVSPERELAFEFNSFPSLIVEEVLTHYLAGKSCEWIGGCSGLPVSSASADRIAKRAVKLGIIGPHELHVQGGRIDRSGILSALERDAGRYSMKDIAKRAGVSEATLYRAQRNG